MVAVAKRRVREQSGFGVALRRLREQAGLSQARLGELVGVVGQAVAKYEYGTTEPTWPVVIRFAAALGVPTDAFLQAPPPPGESPQDRPMGKRK